MPENPRSVTQQDWKLYNYILGSYLTFAFKHRKILDMKMPNAT